MLELENIDFNTSLFYHFKLECFTEGLECDLGRSIKFTIPSSQFSINFL
jgi:hypothetical protein